MKHEKIQKDIIVVTGKILKSIAWKEQNKWPPCCIGILHQPKRPKK